MATRNDITGDSLTTGDTSDAYRNGWDAIFNKPVPAPEVEQTEESAEEQE